MASGSQLPLTPGTTSHRSSTATVSATTSTLPGSQGSQTHDELKKRVAGELTGATYFVDLTKEGGVLYADPETVQTVIDELRTTSTFEELVGDDPSSEAHPRFPSSFSKEIASYKPLADLLNKIVATAKRHILQKQPSLLQNLRFHHLACEVEGLVGSKRQLKPDGVGIFGDLPTTPSVKKDGETKDKPHILWEQIEVVVESKKRKGDMVRQSGSYSRSCILSNQMRFFGLGIGFHYVNMDAYVFVFHHAGLSSSRPLKITEPNGFNTLVEHIVGILSIKDEAAYGLDPTRFRKDGKTYFIINDRCYESLHYIYVRGNLRGRSTIVHRLKGMCMSILSVGLHLVYVA
jgi:hypothetical protein